jgi:soluble lytic murein transglycosylase-like protein
MVTNHTRQAPRSDVRSLLRSRVVQALLVATAVLQGVASYGGTRLAGPDGQASSSLVRGAVKEGVALSLSPVRVHMPASVAKGGAALAAEYRAKGYEVSDELAEKIYGTALRHEIEPEVAFGLVRTESEFRSYATSRVGAIGLTQLMPATAGWFQRGITVAQLRDEDTNLEIGVRYLAELLDRYDGDLHLALTAYNRGTGTVDGVVKRGGDPDNGYAGLVLKGSR